MDPLAHTLIGAALAKSGLEKRSGYAAVALVIGANLPDVDGVTYFVSSDLGLFFRRGWTHGILAMVVLPLVLSGALVLLDRARGERRARFAALFPLSLLAVASHPAFDWLNNYGMRWLMPFHGRWFYGDAVFIVDPWIWLGLGGAVFLATSTGIVKTSLWAALAILVGFLVWNATPALPAKLLFFSGLAVVAALRIRGLPKTRQGMERLTQGALAVVALYVLSLIGLSAAAHRFTLSALREKGIEVERLMVGPVPVTPFVKDIVASTPEGYRYGVLTLLPSMALRLDDETIPLPGPSPVVKRALEQPEVRGFAVWARFPWAEVIEQPNGVLAILRDARYARTTNDDGFGTAMVHLPPVSDP